MTVITEVSGPSLKEIGMTLKKNEKQETSLSHPARIAILAICGCVHVPGDSGSDTATVISTSDITSTTNIDTTSLSETGTGTGTEGNTTDGGMSDSDSESSSSTMTDENKCGNGSLDEEEICDDGENNGQYDHCAEDCSGLGLYCGDGKFQPEGGEECDDGNSVTDDGCERDCRRTLRSITGGHEQICVIWYNGKLVCWGRGDAGVLGYGDQDDVGDDETPADKGFVPIGSGNVIQVAGAGSLSGFGQTCSIFESGDVRCWGYGGFGALGYGNTNDIGDDEFPSTAGSVTVGGDVSQLDVGARHTCAVLTSGDVRCWGTGAQELGYVSSQTMTIGDDEVPATAGSVDVGGKAVQVAVSSYHTCVLLEVGDVRCWGTNYDGELGTGNLPPNKCYDDNNGFHCTYHPECCIGDFEAPGDVEVVDIGGEVTQIAAGNGFSCALLESGQVRCWGKNSNGQLGYGHTMNIGDDEPPASAGDVPLGGIAIQIASGDDHSCAVMETGAVRCWGFGFSGKLGYGNLGTESSLCGGNVIGQFKCDKNSVCCVGDDETPASAGDVPLGEKAIEVAVANASILDSGKITCVLLESGQVRCWGGHLGYGAGYVIIGDDETPEENPYGYIPLF